jgi:hypothetical protein
MPSPLKLSLACSEVHLYVGVGFCDQIEAAKIAPGGRQLSPAFCVMRKGGGTRASLLPDYPFSLQLGKLASRGRG